MTVCVTGDVHHMSLETREQEYMDRTEIEAAIEYAEIASEYGVTVTLFITGKVAVEQPDQVEYLTAMDNVEIGGHNYWAFNTPVHSGWRALEKVTSGRIGSWNGPRQFQRYEIYRTIEALSACGADVKSWRDHAYRHDHYTSELLADVGITHFSDAVGPEERIRQEDGVTVVPVNTPPDHEHVHHAFRTPGSEAVEQFEGPFGTKSVDIDEWLIWVLNMVDSIEKNNIGTILAHPSCMSLSDGLETFEELCSVLSNTETTKMMSNIKLMR